MATPIIASAVTKIVQLAVSFKGERNSLVDIYNTYLPRPRGYRVKYEDQLCATFVSALFIKMGWTDIVPPECGAQQLYNNMDALDRAVIDRHRVPNPGDLIFFGPDSGRIQHVGIVTEVQNGKQIYYYDIQATVGRHTCPVGYSYVKGYGMPDYASKEAHPAPAPAPTPSPAPEVPIIKAGDLVRIKDGARWYRGYTIPKSVMEDQWYVIQNKDGRAVLGQNLRRTRNIQSAIHDTDLILVNGAAEEDQTKEFTVTVKLSVYNTLKQRAFDEGMSLDEFIASLA